MSFFFIRIKKTEMILKMLHDFEQGLENLRSWMDNVEMNLQKPYSLNVVNVNDLRAQQQSIHVCHNFFFYQYKEIFFLIL